METYVVKLDSQKPKFKQRLVAFLLFTSIYFVLIFGWKTFWPTSSERFVGPWGVFLEAGAMSVVWGLWMTFMFRKGRSRVTSFRLMKNL